MIRRSALVALLVLPLFTLRADTALGDWGHFLRYAPKTCFRNPDGRAFTVSMHLMRWPVERWNKPTANLRVTDPEGKILHDGELAIEGHSATLNFPAGPAGTYTVEANLPVKHPVRGADFWLESSLDQSVVWIGGPAGHAVMDRWLIVQCSVPRRWWFWVPPGTQSFTCRSQWIQSYQSQREDWGISVFSPRGQRVRMLWGDKVEAGMTTGNPSDNADRTMTVTVPVEPGASGRFWSVELRFADSHNYSKVSFSLEGVPPYVSRSPEEWFDPTTGQPPQVPLYDDDAFMQFAIDAPTKARFPWLQHFSPCPALGDPDGADIRGQTVAAFWNPENRKLRLGVGTYLPPTLGTGTWPKAALKVTGAGGKVIFSDPAFELQHLHGNHGLPPELPETGAGVFKVVPEGAERWFAFTYPAMPAVLEGAGLPGDAHRFEIATGTARDWYFYVPKGTASFGFAVRTGHPQDILAMDVDAPDRTVARAYGHEAAQTVTVPPGMDGKLWRLRLDIGSGSVMTPTTPNRYLGINLQLDLSGVPGYLAPTWEQWFDPAHPLTPNQRAWPQ